MTRFALAAILAPLVVTGGCESRREAAPAGAQVTVFAAASTKDALEEIGRLFRERTGISVRVSPGPSNTLAAQIVEGAPAELFLSASEEWAGMLKSKGLVDRSRNLLGNVLV